MLPLSQLFQKIINSFQIQLNKFLIYQLNYLKYLKIQKEAGSHTNTNNSLINIVSDPDLQNFDTSRKLKFFIFFYFIYYGKSFLMEALRI